MNFSPDVIKLNPELATARHVTYQTRPERLLLDDGFDSQWERDFDLELKARGHEYRLHGLTFNLPGGVTYTPDFVEWCYNPIDSGITIYEIKGNMRMRNARDSRTRFKIAAGLYPCFRWVWVTRSKRGAWLEKRYR